MIVIRWALDAVRHVALSIFSYSVAHMHSYHVFQRAGILDADEARVFSSMVCAVWIQETFVILLCDPKDILPCFF